MRDAPVNQPGRLVASFHPFRHSFQVEFLCQQQHGVKHRRGYGFGADTLHKAAIDFQVVERIFFQVDQRAMASAEIIDGNLEIVFMQPGEDFAGVFLPHHGALGDFKYIVKMIGGHTGDPRLHVAAKTGRCQMLR